MQLIIVTGLSGAGKSTVIHAMEDIGYFCVDNLPAKLIPVFASLIKDDSKRKKVAIVSDVRAEINFEEFQRTLEQLNEYAIDYKILFLDCKDDVLLNRFRLARRSHPLVEGDYSGTAEAIKRERQLLEPIRQMADFVIDTTSLNLNTCKNRIFDFFKEADELKGIKIQCVSFGFKHGVPQDADYIFDVRSLPNPYYIEELKPLFGTDERVSSYVMSFQQAVDFEKHLFDFCDYVVPLCANDGRSQMVIAIGCTGGHHRSVTFAEALCRHLRMEGYKSGVSHRDINK